MKLNEALDILEEAGKSVKKVGRDVLKEDSLDDFKPGHSVNQSNRWFTVTGKIKSGDRSEVENLLEKAWKHHVSGRITGYDDFTESFRVCLTCKNSKIPIKYALKCLLGTKYGCFYIHYRTSNLPMDIPSIYSPEPTKNCWNMSELDRLLQEIMS